MDYVLGIDAGGSKYLVKAATLDGKVIGEYITDSSRLYDDESKYMRQYVPEIVYEALEALGGPKEAERHEKALAERGCDMVASVKGTELYASDEGTLFSFNLKGYSSDVLSELLNEKNIAVRGGFHCAPLAHRALRTGEQGAVRLSFGITNREEELDAFYRALCDLAFNRRR